MLIVCEAFCGFHLNFRENVKIELGYLEHKKRCGIICQFEENKLNAYKRFNMIKKDNIPVT